MSLSTHIFQTRLEAFVNWINKIDSRIFIFVILCLNLLSFTLGDNEEAYFALAKQYIDPSWIPESFTFTEWVGTRFLFQNIAGFALKYLNFEQLAFWGRMFNYACYAFPLAIIFKELNIKNVGILCILPLYVLNVNTQSFFGMEWLFGGFEGKTLAYIFVFYGLYYILKEKFVQAAFFAALASYFHILVGGWFFVLVFLCSCLHEFNIKQQIRTGLIYIAVVSPFILYLGTYLTESNTIINGVNIDWVYSFFRNTHHTAPMHRVDALTKILPRVVISFLLLVVCVCYFRKSTDFHIRKLNQIVIVSLCMLFVALIITYIDTNGRILKYYLFRIAAIGTFSAYLMIFLFLRNKLDPKYPQTVIRSVFFVVVGLFFLFQVGKNIHHLVFPKENKELSDLANYVSDQTDPNDIYLFLEKDELSFSRKTRREALVVFKFDPGGGEKIYEWYTRERMREHLRDDISYLDTITNRYKLHYLITLQPVEHNLLKEIYKNNTYHLYELSKRK